MHPTSMKNMKKFLDTFDRDLSLKILDIGSQIVTKKRKIGSYRDLISPSWRYIGIDITRGNNVDIVIEPYSFPIKENSFDLVISGQVMEHVPAFWLWLPEIYRVTKINGYVCIIAPSTGHLHYHPDCWRINPDGMNFILEYVGYKDIKIFHDMTGKWGDVVGIGVKY